MTAVPLAIVSGATGGIGSVVAQHLWYAGYSVLGLGRNLALLGEMGAWFLAHPLQGQVGLGLGLDVCLPQEFWRLHNILGTPLFGDIQALVICHGDAPRPGKAEEEPTLQSAREVMSSDVFGTYMLCQAVWQYMQRVGGGSITIVSSLHAQATYPNRVPYAMAKTALGGLVRGLALDWGPDNIRVNSLLAWQVEGPRTAQVAQAEGEDTLERYHQKSPLRRLVEPEDIAYTVRWLTECASVTGTEIVVDCGVSASMWHRPFEER